MAMTGAVYGDKCFPSQADAMNAYMTTRPVSETSGSTSYIDMFYVQGGQWYLKKYSVSSTGSWTQLSVSSFSLSNTFPPCDPSQKFMDGMTIGWGIAAAIITAYAFRLIQRASA